jgi:hypothetical protein
VVRESIKRESIRQRASRDTERFRQSPKSFWTVEVIGAAMFAVGGALYGFHLQPPNPTTFQQFIFPTVGASIGVIFGFFIVYGLVYIWNLFRAPYLQRNEARGKVDELVQEINALKEDFKKKLHEKENDKKNLLAALLQTGDRLFNQHIDTMEEFRSWELELNKWYSLAVHQITEKFSSADAILFQSVSPALSFSFPKAFKNSNDKHSKHLNVLRVYLANLRDLLKRI